MVFNWKEVHHLYYGVILIILGIILWCLLSGLWTLITFPFFFFGVWFAADDIYQHVRQIWQPEYQSSLHRWFVRELYPNPIIRKLNIWLDKIFASLGKLFSHN